MENKTETWSRTLGADTFTVKLSNKFLMLQYIAKNETDSITRLIPFEKIIAITLDLFHKRPLICIVYQNAELSHKAVVALFFNFTSDQERITVNDSNKTGFDFFEIGQRSNSTAYDLMDFLSNV